MIDSSRMGVINAMKCVGIEWEYWDGMEYDRL